MEALTPQGRPPNARQTAAEVWEEDTLPGSKSAPAWGFHPPSLHKDVPSY